MFRILCGSTRHHFDKEDLKRYPPKLWPYIFVSSEEQARKAGWSWIPGDPKSSHPFDRQGYWYCPECSKVWLLSKKG